MSGVVININTQIASMKVTYLNEKVRLSFFLIWVRYKKYSMNGLARYV